MKKLKYISQLKYNSNSIASQKLSDDALVNIETNITEIQKKLDSLIDTKMPNIADKEILELSQELDSLIYIYMRMLQKI